MANETPIKIIKRAIKRPIRFVAKDWALGFAFPRAYKQASEKTAVDPRKVVFVDTKASQMPDSFALMYDYLEEHYDLDLKFVGLGQNEGIGWVEYYKRCLALCQDLASAQAVFLADASDVISCLPLRSETKVVQLWHACGAFKKWGMSTANLLFGNTKKQINRHPFYKNLSLVTVSSPEVAWAYREAMDLESQPEVVQATGVSRTDSFFDEAFLEDAREEIESVFPAVKGKKILLYAPTFRGHVSEAEGPNFLDIEVMRQKLKSEWTLLIKHHPFVKTPPEIPESCLGFAFMATDIPTDKLLAAADALVTDYSSVVFEFSLFGRPISFLAPDKNDYCDWRGFYYPYEEMTPGPVFSETGGLAEWAFSIAHDFDPTVVEAFRNKFMSACDGHATERILAAVNLDFSAYEAKPLRDRMAAKNPDGIDISIVVPAYNASPTLPRTIDSVLAQTYPKNRMELIVVDDCSSDDTWEILQQHERKNPELVHALQTQSQSGSPAEPRNIGLAAAQGEYVFFLDADDWLGAEAVERMLRHVYDWNSDVLLVKLRGEDGRQVPKSMFDVSQPKADIFRSKVMWTFAPLKLFRRSLIQSLRFPDFMPEDISFVLRAYLDADVVSVASDYAYYHVAAEQGDANASVTTWNDVDSNLRAYEDIFRIIETRIPEGKDREVVLKRIFGRDVLNTLCSIGVDSDTERARRQLRKLIEITASHYEPKLFGSFTTRAQRLFKIAYDFE